MDALRSARQRLALSQRAFATRAGLSFRGYQLLESPDHNARIESREKVAAALGLPAAGVRLVLDEFLSLRPNSIRAATLRILVEGADSWKGHLFEFVDAFRREQTCELVQIPAWPVGSDRLDALVASTVEAICAEADLPAPPWCNWVSPLAEPWFVSGSQNLKASALAESPPVFRRRNIFVLGNFLSRA